MPFNLESFLTIRPFAYHLTSDENLSHLRKTRRLRPAADLIEQAERYDLARERRTERTRIALDGEEIWLQSQRPLHEGNIDFENGWRLEDLVGFLNNHVFFWPGTAEGPNRYGQNFANFPRTEDVSILRVESAVLFRENSSLTPLFCRYNSGSPRCSNGRKSPRGPRTFLPSGEFPGTRSEVAELTFRGEIVLPSSTMIAAGLLGNWAPLFES
jgi:hypothetical protein